MPDEVLDRMPLAFYWTCRRFRRLLETSTAVFHFAGKGANTLAQRAVLDGKLWALQSLRKGGLVPDVQIAIYAAALGRLGMLQLLAGRGFPYRYAILAACMTGEATAVRWLHHAGGVWPEEASAIAAGRLHWDIVEFVLEQGLPWHDRTERRLWSSFYKEVDRHRGLFGSTEDEAVAEVLPAYAAMSRWLGDHAPPHEHATRGVPPTRAPALVVGRLLHDAAGMPPRSTLLVPWSTNREETVLQVLQMAPGRTPLPWARQAAAPLTTFVRPARD